MNTGAHKLPRWAGVLAAWVLGALPAPSLLAQPSGEAANRECATCHVMWLTDFKRTDVTPLIAYEPMPMSEAGRVDVASTERMCFSCHDGFVLDSRFAWRERRHDHPAGVKPSDKVKIPTSGGKVVFPLSSEGKVYCGTCHSAHGVDFKQKDSPTFLRAKNVDSSLCLACHLDQATGPEEGNHPVFAKLAKLPAELAAAGARGGREGTVICQSCHRMHGAAERKMLVVDNAQSRLCQTCHADKKEVMNSKHDLALLAPEARNRNNQTAAESGTCGACHVPHNGKGPALWAREPLKDADPTAAACLGCHHDEGIAKKKTPGKHSHPVNVAMSNIGVTTTAKGWTSRFAGPKDRPLVPLPLYDAHGLHAAKDGRVGCGSCHDPHVWSPVSPSVKSSKDARVPEGAKPVDPTKVEGDGTSSFLRIALDADSSLCTNCHVDKAAVARSKHSATVMATAGAPGAAPADSLCGSCHQPHNGQSAFLWARAVGSGKGPTEKLCNECHREGGSAARKLTGANSHPVAVAMKRRPAKLSLPLFDEHGKVAENGQVDCGSCHDPHQWIAGDPASKAGANARVDGNARTSFLRLPAAPDGELCVQCHTEQRLVRKTEHDLAVVAPKATNFAGQGTADSGVCGQCHVPHHAPHALRLWARTPGKAADPNEQLCRSCHDKGGMAQAKQPPAPRHPESVSAWSQTIRARFRVASAPLPVFDTKGSADDAGVISCATCHNPHQWSPRAPVEGPGRNTEGDTRSSFLRVANSGQFLCADCHGQDALFRYKYFHGQSSRKAYPLYR